jgi:tripartite-type tricarboxylate transporter receptor subunit TctC
MNKWVAITAFLTAFFCASFAYTQSFPAKPIRVLVGFPPGSAADITARTVGAKVANPLGQQMIVESRPGASSNIATEIVAKAPPDGYTLFLATIANTINATLYPKLPFDFVRDFTPVILTAATPNLLAVHPSVPVRSVAELVALAKKRPGRLNYASSGAGSSPHLSAELFKSMTGINMTHIPYKGSPPAVADLVAGEVALMFSPTSTVLPHVQSGRLRALGISTLTRLASLPDLPTIAESGLPGYETITWFGFVAPAGTPAQIVARLNGEILKVLHSPDVRRQFATQGIEVLGGTPEQFAAYIRDEITKWAKVIRAAGMRIE